MQTSLTTSGYSIHLRHTVRTLAVVGVWAGAFYGIFFISRLGFVPNVLKNYSIALLISAIVCSLLTVGVLAILTQRQISRPILFGVMFFCILTDVALNQSMISGRNETQAIENINALEKENGIDSKNHLLIHRFAAINLSLLGIALCGGILVSGIIEKPSYLIPISIIAGIADTWSVIAGVTKEIAASKIATGYFLLHFPVFDRGIEPLIGVTDFLFAAMYFDLSRRFHFPVKKTLFILAASFFSAIAIVPIVGPGIPVLPVMATIFIVAYFEDVKITDTQEKRDAVLGALIVTISLAAATFLF